MSRRSSFLSSAIGRRLLALFFIAAFLPVAAMMLIAVMKVDSALDTALDDELAQSAKAYGMQLIERLSRQEQQFRVVDEPGGWDRLRDEVEGQRGDFAGLGRLTPQGDTVQAVGDLPGRLGIDAHAVARLADNTTVLLPSAAVAGRLVLLRRHTRANGQVEINVAAPKMQQVWGNPEAFPPQTDFCIATARGELLRCSEEQHLPNVDWAALSHGGARALRWDDHGETLRAAAWTLFIESRFRGDDWVILAIQPERFALQPATAFRATFLPVGVLTLLLVVLVSTNQIRRILTPLSQLIAGAVRMAHQDFRTRVAVVGRDEFGQLAGAFNTMADRLGMQFRMFEAFAEIDRTILTTLDLSDVAASATRSVKEITGAKLVALALMEPGSTDRLRVYSAEGLEVARWAGLEFHGRCHDVSLTQSLTWTPAPPLPAGFLELLRTSGATQFALVPVARGSYAAGVLVLGDAAPRPLDDDAAAQVSGVADRIAIALAAAERDRKLYEQAHFDALTGLPNRYHLQSLLTQALARAQRQGNQVAVLFVDLDNFKRTNDTLGHAAGDALLQAAAARLRNALGEGDVLARLGGDEFTIVIEQATDARAAGAAAHKAIEVLSQPFPVQGQDMYVGASIGIALYPNDGATTEELLKRADTAMYRAKARGRGGVAFFEDRMNVEASERARLDRELRHAVQRNEFVLHYQPQFNVHTRRVESVEALVRWLHPQRGLLPPGAFIGAAEENGLIEPLGAWVLETSCAQLAAWRAAGLPIQHVAVNVSIRQLLRPGFYGHVQRVLVQTRLAPEALVLEVTESMFADAQTVEVLARLRRLGVGIAVDDFGTGYSSFAYLRTLPITTLKIDRSFIADVATNGAAATIVAAIIKMAQALSKDVVAEGVEDADQIAFLTRSGCDQLQGYAISRPMEAGTLERYVAGMTPGAGAPEAAAADTREHAGA